MENEGPSGGVISGRQGRPIEVHPFVFNDGGEWIVYDLRRDRCVGLPLVARSNFRSFSQCARMHVHSGCVEVFLCLKGRARFRTEEGDVRVMPGQVFISGPDQSHCRISSSKGLRLYRAVFALPRPTKCVLGLSAEETRYLVRSLAAFPGRVTSVSDHVREAFERIFDICGKDDPGTVPRRLGARAAALELWLALADSANRPKSSDRGCHPKVAEIVGRIEADPTADYPCIALAREAMLSPVAFNRAFRQLTGFTPHAFLLMVRVQHAREELAQGRTISAVATKYRFPSTAHFSTTFRGILGVRPTDCRKVS